MIDVWQPVTKGADSLSGHEIYTNFYGGTGDDGRWIVTSAQTVHPIAGAYADRAERVLRLVDRMEQSWQGAAAGAAGRGAGPLAVEHAEGARKIAATTEAMGELARAYLLTKHTVTPVPDAPKKPPVFDNVSRDPLQSSYEARLLAFEYANANNVDAMADYESQSAATRSTFPDFATDLTMDNATIGVRDQPSIPSASATPSTETPAGGSAAPSSAAPAPAPAPAPAAPAPSGVSPTPSQGEHVTTPNRVTPSTAAPESPARPAIPAQPVGQTGPGPAVSGPLGTSGPFAAPRPGVTDGLRGGSPLARSTPGGTALGRGVIGAGSPAGRGMGNGFLPPAGRANGAEDTEHQRLAFLIEPNPEGVFGTDEITAPPVIGE